MKWKDHFVDAQAAIKSVTQASGGSFGSTNAAASSHGTGTAVSTNFPTADLTNDARILSGTVNKLDGYLETLVTAATKKRDVLGRLVANN